MSRRRGKTLNNQGVLRLLSLLLLMPLSGHAMYVGDMTFALPADSTFVAKRIVNNNPSARLYSVAVMAIDRPGEDEVQGRPVDGEILFAPKMMTLQQQQSDYFKFYYHGPQDDHERYYRVTFREIPTQGMSVKRKSNAEITMAPVVVFNTILVIRPRQVDFKWQWDKATGALINSGNTYFQLLLKAGCHATDEQSENYYMRPGDTVHSALLRQRSEKYIIYNDKFISLGNDCTD